VRRGPGKRDTAYLYIEPVVMATLALSRVVPAVVFRLILTARGLHYLLLLSDTSGKIEERKQSKYTKRRVAFGVNCDLIWCRRRST
jgi:hypothetical protein